MRPYRWQPPGDVLDNIVAGFVPDIDANMPRRAAAHHARRRDAPFVGCASRHVRANFAKKRRVATFGGL